jgi:hypothetical protein
MQHAEALRAIGHVLDADEAHEVTIDETPQEIVVSYAAGNGQTKQSEFRWDSLTGLNYRLQDARGSRRTSTRPVARVSWSELLRTLGQELEEQQAGPSSITGDMSWLTASWSRDGAYATRQYETAELWDASRRRAAARTPYA